MRIGILGGGQLGWMTILEGRKLGLSFYVLEKDTNYPACKVADRCFLLEQVDEFLQSCDVITYEFEHIDEGILEKVGDRLTPSLEVLNLKRSRLAEKTFYSKNRYPTARFTYAKTLDLQSAVSSLNTNVVLKTDTLGYDGKGQYRIKSLEDLMEVQRKHSPEDVFLVEEYLDFDFEYSVIGVRDGKGNLRTYPVTVNFHSEGILLYNFTSEEELKEGIQIVESLMEDLNIVGLLAVEFFYINGKTLINEMAPRPHNTGHYTLDACFTSQFENLVRALCNLPLGSTKLKAYGAMLNLIGVGKEDIDLESILSIEGTKLYWYSKEKRSKRKMGHINIVDKDQKELLKKLDLLKDMIYAKA